MIIRHHSLAGTIELSGVCRNVFWIIRTNLGIAPDGNGTNTLSFIYQRSRHVVGVKRIFSYCGNLTAAIDILADLGIALIMAR